MSGICPTKGSEIFILAHRGYWKKKSEENTCPAFKRALENGFGIETDVRDQAGTLVVSHEIPGFSALEFQELLMMYQRFPKLPLAINIKASGLQRPLSKLLKKYPLNNYFVFDLAVPDIAPYFNYKIPVFTRESECEREPCFYAEAQGIWMDELRHPWIKLSRVQYHLKRGKQVCLVSPELHGRDYHPAWKKHKTLASEPGFMLCTDLPDQARSFFHE